jgi:hypothetical protein
MDHLTDSVETTFEDGTPTDYRRVSQSDAAMRLDSGVSPPAKKQQIYGVYLLAAQLLSGHPTNTQGIQPGRISAD